MKKEMKRIYLLSLILVGFAFASCSDIESIAPESGRMISTQVQETYANAPDRAIAPFAGMFTDIGKPCKLRDNPDDWEFLLILFCNDMEGADALIPDSGYNWFSVCGELSSRSATYRNPLLRYSAPYNMIGSVNTFLNGFGENPSADQINMMAQARALRAWSYQLLAQAYQFNYQIAGDKPCVPIVTQETIEFTNNPRASVKEVYDLILEDLNYAVENLEGASRTSKMYIDGHVAHGLRARVYLDMGEWQKAYDDAVKAAEGYTPATLAEVSKPSFYDLSEHNWIWGYDMTTALTQAGGNSMYANPSSWLRSFSGYSYSAACQVYTCINTMLWNKIPAGDIRKQWWVDENLESTLLDGLAWPGFDDVANANDGGDTKLPYIPYTNVKFGCITIGTQTNDEDMVMMRVEEMILIQAECQAHMGNASQATQILENFVNTYRMKSGKYSVNDGGRNLLDEIWFQRRVELWGEGFYVPDMHRLNKPLVRFHDNEASTNMPAAFRFNLPADDPWLLMRFVQSELNTNFGIEDNTGGHQPVTDENPGLRDGVTD